jgi:hypothetical protein
MQKQEFLNREDFISQLISEIPDFLPYYKEHLADVHGEVLPYLLIADFVPWQG